MRVAKTYGPVELTPNREYMLVTEFFTNATNLGDADVDDQVIDEGLQLVRTFWDIGVSHRDIKPANLLVREGHLQLVDVSGVEVRPSPWRQAVDLANIMLTMALRSDPDAVYERAVLVFTPEEIGEGFACAVGMAIPTELQSRLEAGSSPLDGALQGAGACAPTGVDADVERPADRVRGGCARRGCGRCGAVPRRDRSWPQVTRGAHPPNERVALALESRAMPHRRPSVERPGLPRRLCEGPG